MNSRTEPRIRYRAILAWALTLFGFAPCVAQEPPPGRNREAGAVAPRRPGSEIQFNNPTTWGDWSEPMFCPQGYYVCGLKQRVEDPVGSEDDTAMNAVAFYCCPLAARGKSLPWGQSALFRARMPV